MLFWILSWSGCTRYRESPLDPDSEIWGAFALLYSKVNYVELGSLRLEPSSGAIFGSGSVYNLDGTHSTVLFNTTDLETFNGVSLGNTDLEYQILQDVFYDTSRNRYMALLNTYNDDGTITYAFFTFPELTSTETTGSSQFTTDRNVYSLNGMEGHTVISTTAGHFARASDTGVLKNTEDIPTDSWTSTGKICDTLVYYKSVFLCSGSGAFSVSVDGGNTYANPTLQTGSISYIAGGEVLKKGSELYLLIVDSTGVGLRIDRVTGDLTNTLIPNATVFTKTYSTSFSLDTYTMVYNGDAPSNKYLAILIFQSGSTLQLTSTDGVTWTEAGSENAPPDFDASSPYDSSFFAIGGYYYHIKSVYTDTISSQTVYRSDDGLNWESVDTDTFKSKITSSAPVFR